MQRFISRLWPLPLALALGACGNAPYQPGGLPGFAAPPSYGPPPGEFLYRTEPYLAGPPLPPPPPRIFSAVPSPPDEIEPTAPLFREPLPERRPAERPPEPVEKKPAEIISLPAPKPPQEPAKAPENVVVIRPASAPPPAPLPPAEPPCWGWYRACHLWTKKS